MDTALTHFYSDPHFGHANIIKHARRPFADLDKMHEALIDRYRLACTHYSDPFVLWLGDCHWRPAGLRDVLDDLPGRKALVIGNHDGKHRRMAAAGFDFVAERLWVDLGGVPAIVSHYPPVGAVYAGERHDGRFQERRPQLGPGQVCIHGHTHERLAKIGKQKRVHVGVDAWNFSPAPIEQVATLARSLVRTHNTEED